MSGPRDILWCDNPAGWVETLVNTFFESRVEQLFDLARLAERALISAGLEYRLIRGLATYLYVEQTEPHARRQSKPLCRRY